MVKNGELEVAVTTEILAEYEEQLSDFYAPAVAAGVLQQLDILENIRHIQVYYKWNLIAADPDDNKFTDCAVAASADYLVTYDRHFRVLSSIGFPPITCLTIEELKEVLNGL
ncbi:MAG: PIN domain-containing protein [Saprospiraceae bacterium]|nr:PIN domain-containing protein [Saprospiraceae bacterium]